MNPDNPKVGELVQTVFQSSSNPLPVYREWGSKAKGFPEQVEKLGSDEIGLVLESLEPQGGNGCKILFRGDKVGWVNINYIKRLNHETR